MKSKNLKLQQKEIQILEVMSENIKLARLRRKLTMSQVAERANISRSTLWNIEKGSDHIGIGTILKVLSVLGLEESLELVAENDLLGRKLQDVNILIKKRGAKSKI